MAVTSSVMAKSSIWRRRSGSSRAVDIDDGLVLSNEDVPVRARLREFLFCVDADAVLTPPTGRGCELENREVENRGDDTPDADTPDADTPDADNARCTNE